MTSVGKTSAIGTRERRHKPAREEVQRIQRNGGVVDRDDATYGEVSKQEGASP
jgi:hypothetical protein